AGEAPGDRVFLADHGDVDIALLEDAVVDHQAHRVFEQFRQARVEPVGNVGQQLERNVLMYAAGAEPGAVHARARSAFEEVEAILADFEQPQVGVIAPTSITCDPMLSMWLQMRVSSANKTRRYWARSGTSRFSSFSIAST